VWSSCSICFRVHFVIWNKTIVCVISFVRSALVGIQSSVYSWFCNYLLQKIAKRIKSDSWINWFVNQYLGLNLLQNWNWFVYRMCTHCGNKGNNLEEWIINLTILSGGVMEFSYHVLLESMPYPERAWMIEIGCDLIKCVKVNSVPCLSL
jgi:hypothetical protein